MLLCSEIHKFNILQGGHSYQGRSSEPKIICHLSWGLCFLTSGSSNWEGESLNTVTPVRDKILTVILSICHGAIF